MTEPTYSPGLEGIYAGETAISTLRGGLQYYGYSIEDLAEHATFEEVVHLLLHGELPNASELKSLKSELAAVTTIPEPLIALLDRKSTRLNSSHIQKSRMPSSA